MDEYTIKAIKDRMNTLGMNNEALANALGSNRVSVSEWLRGVKTPKMDTFYTMLAVLGLEMNLVVRE